MKRKAVPQIMEVQPFLLSDDAVDNLHSGEYSLFLFAFGSGINSSRYPSLDILHEFAVVVVGSTGGELESRESGTAESLHGSIDVVDKVEVLECDVDALISGTSGIGRGTCNDMESYRNVRLPLPS